MSSPILSIITPVYNSAQYLEESVNSILRQTFLDFELILVDDGSTDGSSVICDSLQKNDNRIVVVHQENREGVASARNFGIDKAKGKYIGFVDSDDIISPIMYQVMMEIALEQDADIVQCSHTRSKEALVNNVNEMRIEKEILDGIGSLKRIYRTHYTNSLALWTKIYRKELFGKLRFTEGTAFEDDELVPKLLSSSKHNVFFELPLYCYIRRENSIITNPKTQNIMALTRHLEERMLMYEKLELELYLIGLRHFFGYLKGKSIEALFQGTEVQSQAVCLLKKYRKRFWKIGDKYERFGLCCLSIPVLEKWVLKNDWEPIQNILRKIRNL